VNAYVTDGNALSHTGNALGKGGGATCFPNTGCSLRWMQTLGSLSHVAAAVRLPFVEVVLGRAVYSFDASAIA
jgi:hypothetical protein